MQILIVQRTIDPPGGGNAVAAWMLQALAGRHGITTLTERRWSPEAVDRFFGTSLTGVPITQIAPFVTARLMRGIPSAYLHTMRMAMLYRRAQRDDSRCDLMITADNIAAFDRPGLQYLHYPAEIWPPPSRWPALVRAYYRLCDRLSRRAWGQYARNETLTNSEWTARELARLRGIAAKVLYPPVADPGAARPWRERSNTFLCIGRFNGSKRIELAIRIIAHVRATLPDARLHIVGSNVDAEYTRRLKALAHRFAEWIRIDEDLSQREVFDLMGRSRYGIHAMEGEHFGMAVAEMARAGCVVFVHNSGGQVEAVGGRPELLWDTLDDAVARINAVVRQPRLQEELSDGLTRHAAKFSTERFVREFREIVERRR